MAIKKENKVFEWQFLGRLFQFVKPYKWVFHACGFVTFLLAVLAVVRAYLVKYAFDFSIVEPNMDALFTYTMVMLVFLLAESIFQFLFSYYAGWLGQMVIKDIRLTLKEHLLGFRMDYFDNTPIGTLVTRVISDIEAIAAVFSQGVLTFIGDLSKIVLIVGFMFYTDWKLTLICLVVFPLLLVATKFFQKFMKASFEDERTAISKLNTFVQEHIQGMNIVQIFNREEAELDKFKSINAEHRDATIRSIWYFSIFLPIIEVFSAVALGLLVWQGGIMVATGSDIILGDIILFILLINMLFRPVRQLADRINSIQRGVVASKRVFMLLDYDGKEETQDTDSEPRTQLIGQIEFSDVWFAYKDENWVLKGVNFEMNPGEMVAIVGATGAGKSSILSLITRFYDYQKGQILIDGKSIENYSKSHLRKEIAIVMQDVFLFSDSVMKNVNIQDKLDDESIINAAAEIGIDGFINGLPGKFDYNVGERGAMLSTGQRQLLAFLRTYVSNPSILILDEATSSIDTETEKLIQKATEVLTKNRTSIVVAHRLSTVRNADKILVMDQGKIVEFGTHEELLLRGEYYAQLYEIQFSKDTVV